MNIFAVTDEKYDPKNCPIPEKDLIVSRGIEVGHIFYFGTKYSKSMNAFVLDENGNKVYPEMGSYGIGVSRLVGAIIEASHDDRGIIWPEPVAPFDLTILNLHTKDQRCQETARKIYDALNETNKNAAAKDVLYDDREISAGEKLADADLIGIPYQIIVGQKKMAQGVVELKTARQERSES